MLYTRLCHPVDHIVKIKENEKREHYLDLARELKTLWNMNLTVIPIVHGALGTIPKVLVKRIGSDRNQKTSRDRSE